AMRITVTNLVVSASLTVNGHIVSGGNTPGIGAGAAACTAPAVSITGTDTSGTIQVVVGSGCSASGLLATVTYATAFGSPPHITLTPGNAAALALGAYVDNATASATTFGIGTNTVPVTGTTYEWNYQVIQ
ncbi:MAG TPA: hypothetical protein VI322_05090, partial [Candidatus Saccharimonadia bacterium]